MGPSYVRQRHEPVFSIPVLGTHDPHFSAGSDHNSAVARHHLGRQGPLQSIDDVLSGLCVNIRDWRAWWNPVVSSGSRFVSTCYVLCRRAPPLSDGSLRGFRDLCGYLLLVSEDLRTHAQRAPRPRSFLAHIHWRLFDFYSDAFARTRWESQAVRHAER